MGKVLILGNLVKDVFLRLEENNRFEQDEKDRLWLDFCLDGSVKNYYKRTSVINGLAVSLEVLDNFNIKTTTAFGDIQEKELDFKDFAIRYQEEEEIAYRYILCHRQYLGFLTNEREIQSRWQVPEEAVDWIFIDRSAKIRDEIEKQIENYLDLAKETKLAIYLKNSASKAEKRLAERADLVFLEAGGGKIKTGGIRVIISEKLLQIEEEKLEWDKRNTGLMTDFETESVVSATILAAIIKGHKPAEALKMAKINAENSKLDQSLGYEKIQDLMKQREQFLDIKLLAKSLADKKIIAEIDDGYPEKILQLLDLNTQISTVVASEKLLSQAIKNQNLIEILAQRGVASGVKLLDYRGGLEDGLKRWLMMGIRVAEIEQGFSLDLKTEDFAENLIRSQIYRKLAKETKLIQEFGILPIIKLDFKINSEESPEIFKQIKAEVLKLLEKIRGQEVESAGLILGLVIKDMAILDEPKQEVKRKQELEKILEISEMVGGLMVGNQGVLSRLAFNIDLRNCPVGEFGFLATASGVPAAITLPPACPPSGPISIR